MARVARALRAAAASRATRRTALAFDALLVEGALIAPAQLSRIAALDAGDQKPSDYAVRKGLELRDELPLFYRVGQALFAELVASPSQTATVAFTQALLRDVFGFTDIASRAGVTLAALDGRVPVVVVPPTDGLDRPSATLSAVIGRRTSAALVVQDWLNVQDGALWGLVCNGERLRLQRDNPSLTRPAYIEADLRRIFEADSLADFAALWLLMHASRFGAPGTPPTDCILERWRQAGQKAGEAARERLRDGVKRALEAVGDGLLRHPANKVLRERLALNEVPLPAFFGQLLRLIYRMIFLLAAEDRGLLHPPEATAAARSLYATGYGLARLRDSTVRPAAWDAHDDLWDGINILFAALAQGEPRLGLPALDGLFAPGGTPELDSAALSNKALLRAVRGDGAPVPVNWRDMETEELGSVYESLLELKPLLTDDGRGFKFEEGAVTKGNKRKTTGSYYTPDSLVQALLASALDPVLDRVQAEAEEPAEALLSVKVLDPACGSGHFLLAAGRHIAARLARLRSGGTAGPEEYRHALRDVARSCLHGVDRNPMAVELTKVALWIETVEPGKPLGFLDANIRCGDALLGVFDFDALLQGIPDAAYMPLAGDDITVCRSLEARNRAERSGQGTLDFRAGGGRPPPAAPLARAAVEWRALPEDTPYEIAEKRRRFETGHFGRLSYAWGEAADLYIAAFLLPKPSVPSELGQAQMVPTTGHVWHALADQQVYPPLVASAVEASRYARGFHWPLEFPDIIASGGFDVVLGNPPWEVMQLGEEEYFAQQLPEIADLEGAARKEAIADLEITRPSIFADYQRDKRTFEASNKFARASGRFDLTGRGKLNTYALFAELFASLTSKEGRAGVILPTGIATDATTARFFAELVQKGRLASVLSFENEDLIFPSIHHAMKFCLLTVRPQSSFLPSEFVFFARSTSDLGDEHRRFNLRPEDIARINPITKTSPIFRSRTDATLTAKIYSRLPILFPQENSGTYNVDLVQNFFSTSNRTDMALFSGAKKLDARETYPVLRGAMIDQFDHRAATYEVNTNRFREPTRDQMTALDFVPQSDKRVARSEVHSRLADRQWQRGWLMGWRDITNATNERTVIVAVFPISGTDDTLSLLLLHDGAPTAATLLANLNSLVLDYVAQQKVGGTHIRKYVISQFPVVAPSAYRPCDLSFITSRVLELTYTSYDIAPFARDLGYDGSPFIWDDDRRAYIRSELDAWYAQAYGLSRDELRYILDPTDVYGPAYPSETFRVLKENEIRRYGEYRTRRLVLEAWDRLSDGA